MGNEELLREDECSLSDCVEPSGHAHDQDGTKINEGDILLDSRGRCYTVVKTPPTILAQGVVSGQRRNRNGFLPPEYVRAYHCFITPQHESVEDGKLLHRGRLLLGQRKRRATRRERHQGVEA